MTHVVTEHCMDCKYMDCVEVCPVDCFHEGPEMLYINPRECIDCELCIPECPVEAIFHENDIPEKLKKYITINLDGSEKYPKVGKDNDNDLGGVISII